MYAYANNYLFYFKKSNKKYDSFFCIITKFYLPKNLLKNIKNIILLIDTQVKNMRTTKLLPILAATIAAGLLVLATSNAAVAQTSSQSIIGGLNAQGTKCQSGTTGDGTCNQAAANENVGNAVSAGSNALSAIGQTNQLSAFTQSGGETTDSGNQESRNANAGNAVSTGLPSK